MEKEYSEIEKTLASLDAVQRAQPSPLMAQRIFQKATAGKPVMALNTRNQAVLNWAIGLAALLVLNFGILYWVQSERVSGNTPTSGSYFDQNLSY